MNEIVYKNVKDSTAHRPSRDFNANFIIENLDLLPDLMEILLDANDKNHHKACWISELIFEKTSLGFRRIWIFSAKHFQHIPMKVRFVRFQKFAYFRLITT